MTLEQGKCATSSATAAISHSAIHSFLENFRYPAYHHFYAKNGCPPNSRYNRCRTRHNANYTKKCEQIQRECRYSSLRPGWNKKSQARRAGEQASACLYVRWNAGSKPEFSGKSSGCLATLLELFKTGMPNSQISTVGISWVAPFCYTFLEGVAGLNDSIPATPSRSVRH